MSQLQQRKDLDGIFSSVHIQEEHDFQLQQDSIFFASLDYINPSCSAEAMLASCSRTCAKYRHPPGTELLQDFFPFDHNPKWCAAVHSIVL